jgi:hypothetical protein
VDFTIASIRCTPAGVLCGFPLRVGRRMPYFSPLFEKWDKDLHPAEKSKGPARRLLFRFRNKIQLVNR